MTRQEFDKLVLFMKKNDSVVYYDFSCESYWGTVELKLTYKDNKNPIFITISESSQGRIWMDESKMMNVDFHKLKFSKKVILSVD